MQQRFAHLPSVVITILLAAIFAFTPPGVNAEIERFSEMNAPAGTFKLMANTTVEVVGVIPLSPKGDVVGSARNLTSPIRLVTGEIITGEMVSSSVNGKDEKRSLPTSKLHLTKEGSKTSTGEQIQGIEDSSLLYFKLVNGQRTTATPLQHYAFITRTK